MKRPIDYPLKKVAADARRKFEEGFTVYQKFTCDGCGSRQTMAEPNHFYTHGTCEDCGADTDIAKKGCGFMAIFGGGLKI